MSCIIASPVRGRAEPSQVGDGDGHWEVVSPLRTLENCHHRANTITYTLLAADCHLSTVFLFCASDCRCSCECGFLVVSKHETRSLLTNATLLTATGGSDSGGQNQEKLSHEYFSSDNETNTRKLLWLCLSKHTIQKDYRPQNCYCDLHTRPNQETFALSDIETIHTFRR